MKTNLQTPAVSVLHPCDRPSVETPDWMSLVLPLTSIAVFHLSWFPGLAWLMAFFPWLLLPAMKLRTARQAFYWGLAVGFGLAAPQLGFFWTIFGAPAIALWLIIAFWTGLFTATGQAFGRRWTGLPFAVAIPILWMGFEFFRSELYYLRFAWITPGHALSELAGTGIFRILGIYGVGAALFLGPAFFWSGRSQLRWTGLVLTLTTALALAVGPWVSGHFSQAPSGRTVHVAGAQIEGIDESQIPRVLDQIIEKSPEAELIVLPEYRLEAVPGTDVTTWCQRHRRHLVVGGRQPAGEGRFRNTAWVIGPEGTEVFSQVKSVPIQFFNDGEPAAGQAVWSSPWGALGIAICYDLSYSRVMDRLIRQRAVALLIPTMDAFSWGPHQHALHARIAPIRAAEYGIPIVRSASSGISQIVDAQGKVTASAPCSEELNFFSGTIHLRDPGSLPLDRWMAPLASTATGAIMIWLIGTSLLKRRQPTSPPAKF